jgi:hypothetical protein
LFVCTLNRTRKADVPVSQRLQSATADGMSGIMLHLPENIIGTVSHMLRCPHLKSKSLRLAVNRPVCLGVRRPSGSRVQFSFLLEIVFRQLRVRYFVAPSLTRGRVCNNQSHYDWRSIGQSAMVSGADLGPATNFFFLL